MTDGVNMTPTPERDAEKEKPKLLPGDDQTVLRQRYIAVFGITDPEQMKVSDDAIIAALGSSQGGNTVVTKEPTGKEN